MLRWRRAGDRVHVLYRCPSITNGCWKQYGQHDELRKIAGRIFATRHSNDIAIQPTILVHDAFLKLSQKTNIKWESRAHFFAVAANATRHLLVDHARRKNAAKRGGHWKRVTLSGVEDAQSADLRIDVIDLEEALQRLGKIAPRQEQIVELGFLAGLTIGDMAKAKGVLNEALRKRLLLKESVVPTIGRFEDAIKRAGQAVDIND